MNCEAACAAHQVLVAPIQCSLRSNGDTLTASSLHDLHPETSSIHRTLLAWGLAGWGFSQPTQRRGHPPLPPFHTASSADAATPQNAPPPGAGRGLPPVQLPALHRGQEGRRRSPSTCRCVCGFSMFLLCSAPSRTRTASGPTSRRSFTGRRRCGLVAVAIIELLPPLLLRQAVGSPHCFLPLLQQLLHTPCYDRCSKHRQQAVPHRRLVFNAMHPPPPDIAGLQ